MLLADATKIRQAAEAAYERARKIANQLIGSKNWEGKIILPNYEKKKVIVEDIAQKAKEEVERTLLVEKAAKKRHDRKYKL
jgi:hypothetical protein